MLVAPSKLPAVIAGIAAGHITDTAQVQASLCYRWRIGDPAGQKQALRLQAFSAVFGYSSGALLGGAVYEYGGFGACAVLQLIILATLATCAATLPVVHDTFRERCIGTRRNLSQSSGARTTAVEAPSSCTAAEKPPVSAPVSAPSDTAASTNRTICGTNSSCLLLPVSLIWLADGFNIGSYICEWSLFAVYFRDAFAWSSTLTGAAQMTGDLLAAAILALTTTKLWARLLLARTSGARSIDKLLLQPPWNLALFFVSYAATFSMLAQPVFAVSVIGQVVMGTVYVFGKQAVQECYVVLSHESLPLFRRLEFVGSCSFNVWMSASSFLSVFAYEHVGMTSPFYAVAVITGFWSLVLAAYFGIRLQGRYEKSFQAAEQELLLILEATHTQNSRHHQERQPPKRADRG